MENLDLRKVVAEIRDRVSRPQRDDLYPGRLNNLWQAWADELASVQHSYEYVHSIRNAVGCMPPSPGTWRARIGARVVRIVQRMLFWYTPQIVRFHGGVAQVFERICSLNRREFETVQGLAREMEQVRSELRLRNHGPEETALRKQAVSNDCAFNEFLFAWKTEQQRVCRPALLEYCEALTELAPPADGAACLTIGAGNHEWLRLLHSSGYNVTAIESNAGVESYASSAGFSVVHWDPLDYMRNLAADSIDVITAIDVLGSQPLPYTLRIAHEARRVLAPDGVFLVQMPNPANLLTATEDFWSDPAAVRLIPLQLMEFTLSYAGLRSMKRFHSDPPPEHDRFPLAGLELVDRLDEHFHASRSYAVLARR